MRALLFNVAALKPLVVLLALDADATQQQQQQVANDDTVDSELARQDRLIAALWPRGSMQFYANQRKNTRQCLNESNLLT